MVQFRIPLLAMLLITVLHSFPSITAFIRPVSVLGGAGGAAISRLFCTTSTSKSSLSTHQHQPPHYHVCSSSSSSTVRKSYRACQQRNGISAVRMISSTVNDAASSAAVDKQASSTRKKRTKVRAFLDGGDELLGQEVVVKGWVRTKRDQKSFAFVEVNDGSSLKGVQVVCQANLDTYSLLERATTGASVAITGVVVESPGQGQKFELQATHIEVLGECPSDYPLQKKRHSQEFLRGIAHLRPRTNTISAVARVRSALAFATHRFFREQGFQYLQSPIITASDCEGAGEMFRVTTIMPSNSIEDVALTEDGQVDFSKDFFGKPAYLTVSGQLSAETHACALGDVYTFGPTFRAENSQTTRHLAEFQMIEPEMAFADLQDDMDNAEAFIKYVVKYAMEDCKEDFDFFGKFIEKSLGKRLEALVSKPFVRIPYRDAVELLREEIEKDPSKWQYPDVTFGTDLQTEHERWLAEEKFGTATFVYNYPRKIKAFYMRDNEDGETVAAMDLLVPGVGELIGGSQREERLEVLEAKMVEFGLEPKDYWWYNDLRKYGSVPHAGYGLGFERLICYVTGIDNIREAIAFPRYPGNADF